MTNNNCDHKITVYLYAFACVSYDFWPGDKRGDSETLSSRHITYFSICRQFCYTTHNTTDILILF